MKINLKHIILVFTVLLISVIISLTGNFTKNDKSQGLDIEYIETELQQKYAYLEEQLKTISEEISTDTESAEKYFYTESSEIFKEQGIGYFYYYKNELKYWTTNNIPLPTSTTFNFFERPMINLNNGWYLCQFVSGEDWHLVGVFQFKKEYSYENDILKNTFYPDYNIDSKTTISLDSITKSDKVCLKDNDSESCFYLIPPEEDPYA
ncbi:MAG: hypothetical protein C0596_18785 [Marinilabiliales bacterium]|nr:MAG: hypothetical protein C0596_18785 [Marinilabiliales bacterium]